MVSPGARRYMVNVCSASFSLSSCKPQKTQVLLWYGLLQMVYAIASPLVCSGSAWRKSVSCLQRRMVHHNNHVPRAKLGTAYRTWPRQFGEVLRTAHWL